MANSYTPGLKLRKPAQGDDYWDDDLNANADILEAASGRASGLSYVAGTGLAVTGGGGLSAAYTAGSCRVGGAKFSLDAGSVAVTDGLNFVYVNAAGQVEAANTPPAPPYCALALVEAAGGAVVRTGDLRRCLIDLQEEHDEAGSHKVIKPTRVEPTGTAGAYRRSESNWREPESQVNNLILKRDSSPLIAWSNRHQGESFGPLIASSLGSGYIPTRANGFIATARVFDTTPGQYSYWVFRRGNEISDDDRYTAVARVMVPGTDGIYSYYQLFIPIGENGYFYLSVHSAPEATAGLRLRLVGWIEPA